VTDLQQNARHDGTVRLLPLGRCSSHVGSLPGRTRWGIFCRPRRQSPQRLRASYPCALRPIFRTKTSSSGERIGHCAAPAAH